MYVYVYIVYIIFLCVHIPLVQMKCFVATSCNFLSSPRGAMTGKSPD